MAPAKPKVSKRPKNPDAPAVAPSGAEAKVDDGARVAAPASSPAEPVPDASVPRAVADSEAGSGDQAERHRLEKTPPPVVAALAQELAGETLEDLVGSAYSAAAEADALATASGRAEALEAKLLCDEEDAPALAASLDEEPVHTVQPTVRSRVVRARARS